MDAIIARIKAFVLRFNPILADDDFLDLNILNTVNRALIFMNRAQLKANYEIALSAHNAVPEQILYDENGCVVPFASVPVPIPEELEVVLASTVIQAYKTIAALFPATTGFLTYIADNGQEQRYADRVISFLTSSNDTDIFAGTTEMMRNYMLPTIIENTNNFQNSNLTSLLR